MYNIIINGTARKFNVKLIQQEAMKKYILYNYFLKRILFKL
jgi:hypothetical protein